MYSQYEEERFILEALKDIPQGRLLDLGASMPTKFSNSRRLIELGWEAVLVDCSPDAIKALATEYRSNEKVIVVQAAVNAGQATGEMERIHLTADFVTTFDRATHDKWKDQVPYYGQMFALTHSVGEIVDGLGLREPFDFINIDLEGQSVDVLLYDTFHRRPTCICVEYDDRIKDVMHAADRHGYDVRYKNGTNVVLAR